MTFKDVKYNRLFAFFAVVAWSFLRGIKEGMVMFKPGVRDHPYFRYYHLFGYAIIGLGFISAITIWGEYDLFAGLALLAWELFELGYSYSRYRVFIPESENVLGFIQIGKVPVRILHITRALIGIALIVWRSL